MTRLSSRRGFTLVEAMIVVAILSIVASVGALLMTQIQNFFLTVNAHNIIQHDDRVALDLMDRFLRQAQASTICIDSPASSTPCSCMGGLSTNGGYWSRICFTTIDGRGMRFYQDGSKMIIGIQNSGGSNYYKATISRNLYYLAFSFDNSNNTSIINVALSASQAVQRGRKDILEMSIQKVRVMN